MIQAPVLLRVARAGIVAALAACALAAEQSTVWLAVTPACPVRGDSVRLQLILGDTLRGCEPTFDSMSCSFGSGRPVAEHPCVQIILRYRTVPADTAATCGTDTVSFGPVFELGSLDSGYYLLYDGTNWDSLGLWYIPVDDSSGLRIAGTVRGIATETHPLSGVRVRLSTPDVVYASAAKARSDVPYDVIRLSRTDSAGSYSFTGIAPGIYRVTFVRPGYTSWSTQKMLSADRIIDAELVKLGSYGTVEGSVMMFDCPAESIGTDCPLLPVSGCGMRAHSHCGTVVAGNYTRLGPPCSTFTTHEGTFRLDSVAIMDSITRIYANHPLFGPDSVSVRLRPDTIAHADFILKPSYRHRTEHSAGALTFTLRSRERSYLPGSSPAFRYEVSNSGSVDTTVSFDEACLPLGLHQVDYRIEYGGRVQLPPPFACQSMHLDVTLRPGESFGRGPEAVGPLSTAEGSPDSACIVAWLREYRELSELRLWVYFEDTTTGVGAPVSLRASSPFACRLRGAALELELRRPQRLSVARYDLMGRRIAVLLAPAHLPAGSHTVTFSPTAALGPSVLRIRGEDGQQTLFLPGDPVLPVSTARTGVQR